MKQSECFVSLEGVPEQNDEYKRYSKLHQAQERAMTHFKTYDKITLSHPWLDNEKYLVPKDMSVADFVTYFLHLLLLEIKTALRKTALGLHEQYVNDMLASTENPLSKRVRVGVAVPELWKWQNKKFFDRLVDVGFPDRLELLSEGRCALTHLIKLHLQETLPDNTSKKQQDKLFSELLQAVFLGYDKGASTLDLAKMVLICQDSIVRIRVVGNSSSTPHGSRRANDEFKTGLVTDIFGPRLQEVLRSTQLDEDSLQCHFDQSFERRKKEVSANGKGDEMVELHYTGPYSLGTGISDKASWKDKILKVDRAYFRSCIPGPIDEEFAENCPFRTIYQKGKVHIKTSGGGSNSAIVQDRLNRIAQGATIKHEDIGDGSHVAAGACLVLADPELSDRYRLSDQSYGIVVAITYEPDLQAHVDRVNERRLVDGEWELENSVEWLLRHKGDPLRSEPCTRWLWHEIESTGDGKHLPNDIRWPLTFELKLVKTDDDAIAFTDGHSANYPSVQSLVALEFEINKDLAYRSGCSVEGRPHSNGFYHGTDGTWRLTFAYRLSYTWRGFLDYFEVELKTDGDKYSQRWYRDSGKELIAAKHDRTTAK